MPFAPEILSEPLQRRGADNVLISREDLIPYAFDGAAALPQMPGCVVFVTTAEQAADLLRLANSTKTPLSR